MLTDNLSNQCRFKITDELPPLCRDASKCACGYIEKPDTVQALESHCLCARRLPQVRATISPFLFGMFLHMSQLFLFNLTTRVLLKHDPLATLWQAVLQYRITRLS